MINAKTTDDLFKPFAPLSTFSAKIKFSYSLGLIDDSEFKIIEIIRKIRNEFSHKWDNLNFQSAKIEIQCKKFNWYGPADNKTKTSKEYFDFAATKILLDLAWRKRNIEKEPLIQKNWTNKNIKQ